MNTFRNRALIAFIVLVITQLACSWSDFNFISYNASVFVYEDLNANGSQDPNEVGFPNATVNGVSQTDSGGSVNWVKELSENDCSISFGVNPPNGYRITESTSSSAVDCSKTSMGLYVKPQQSGFARFGLTPTVNVTISKTAKPTTFTAAGETITYTYIVKSSATAYTAPLIELRDDKLGKINCPKDKLELRESMTCTATYITTDADVARGSITNSVAVYYKGIQFGSAVSATVNLELSSASAQALTGSVLTGQFATFCDPNRAINFRLQSGIDNALVSSELVAGNLVVIIAGTDISTTCSVSADNRILACRYPLNIANFPTEIVLKLKDKTLIQFPFYGEVCNLPSTGSGGSSSGDTTPPIPLACQADPASFECYCATNKDPDCP